MTLEWLDRPFLGWQRGFRAPWKRGWILGTDEDDVGIVGPPRVGKTAGLLIPQALLWDGPIVVASTKPDLIQATGDRREELAARHGGRVRLYMPTARDPVHGLAPLRFSLLDECTDPVVAKSRAIAMTYSSGTARGVSDGTYWQAAGSRLLQGLLHAAAVGGYDVRQVKAWLAEEELEEPAQEIQRSSSEASGLWATDLRGIARVPPRERGSYFAQARQALEALDLPSVVANSVDSDFDPTEFLETRSTLYVVSPTSQQELVAPLVAALIEGLVEHAYRLWHQGRLRKRLLLVLDELANIAPLPSLLKIISEGAGQGVLVAWAVQSLHQLRERYGEQAAGAVFSSTRAKIVFGGSSDERDLSALERLLGDHDVEQRSRSRGPHERGWSETVGTQRLPRVPVSELRAIPSGQALLVYHTYRPEMIDAKLAVTTEPFRSVTGWRAAAPARAPQLSRR